MAKVLAPDGMIEILASTESSWSGTRGRFRGVRDIPGRTRMAAAGLARRTAAARRRQEPGGDRTGFLIGAYLGFEGDQGE
jgi:hypothetical protein